MLILDIDLSPLEKEIKRIKRLPSITSKQRLDRVLNTGYRITQQDVHVITGSLRGSGATSSTMLLGVYSGSIKYGGPTTGPKNPVDYAWYEQRRDADHDFMAGLHVLHPLWVNAIKEILTK